MPPAKSAVLTGFTSKRAAHSRGVPASLHTAKDGTEDAMGERFEAAIFDLDGTLLDSLGDLADSMNAVLRGSGLPEHPRAAYKRFVGEGVQVLAQRALPPGQRDDETVARTVAAMLEEYQHRWDATSAPYPGVPELLDALTARGLQLAMLSNKPEAFTRRIAERFFGRWPFAAVRGARPDVPKKPDPTAARAIATQLDVAPDQILFVGDTAIDMRTATAARMFPVGVLWGFRGVEELRGAGARALIAEPAALLTDVLS